MPTKKSKKEVSELIISNVPEILLAPINNVADNMGITMNEFLKPHIRKIIDSYPEYLKKEPSNKKCKECRIRGISPNLVKQLYNIADNLKVSHSQILKVGLNDIKDSYSEKMRQTPPKF